MIFYGNGAEKYYFSEEPKQVLDGGRGGGFRWVGRGTAKKNIFMDSLMVLLLCSHLVSIQCCWILIYMFAIFMHR